MEENTIKAFHYLNWNSRVKSSVEEEHEQLSKQTSKETKARKAPETNMANCKGNEMVGQTNKIVKPEVLDKTGTHKSSTVTVPERETTKAEKKRKKEYLEEFGMEKKKMKGRQMNQKPSPEVTSLLKFMGENPVKEYGDHAPMHYGLPEEIASKLKEQVACAFASHKEPLLECLLNGSITFNGNQVIDERDLQSLHGGHVCDEDNYLSNFVIESYFGLIACACRERELKIEYMGWEQFEKGVRTRPAKELLKGKAPLMEQDVILVPCNSGASKHWFLVVVMMRERQVIVLDSLATSAPKPSAVEAKDKIWYLLQELDNGLDVKQWSFSTNTKAEILQQQNSFDCGVFLCAYARSLLLGYPIPESDSFQNFRSHMLLELHRQELQGFSDHDILIQQDSYYAVSYGKSYYIGRALEIVDADKFKFKFLHATVSSGAKLFTWPGHDDVDTVHISRVFYGPLITEGVRPFLFPQLHEVDQVHKWLKKVSRH